MNRFVRRAVLGAIAGGMASIPALLTSARSSREFIVGIIVGAAYSASVTPIRGAYVDNMMTAASLGVPLWGVASVIVFPLLSGRHAGWKVEEMRSLFPALVGWIFFGSLLGLLLQTFEDLAERRFGLEVIPQPPPILSIRHIVILGGGFAGMKTAECLEEQLAGDRSVSISLVSETNALLFTPMLAEVAGSSLEPSHISAPLRSSLGQTNVVRGRVSEIDLEGRRVFLDGVAPKNAEFGRELKYDHLVLALGSVSNYFGMPNVEKLAFNFKTLFDAIRIRNHVIEMFERADREQDPTAREKLLTFVVAGGGFAGVELAGALNDFAHGILPDYRNLGINELRVILVHARDRILPELSVSLAHYAMEKMQQRGVGFRLNARLLDARPGVVILSDGQIGAETLVWTAGTAPNPLLKALPVTRDQRGAVVVNSTLAVSELSGVWALGDCAAVSDAKTGKPCPPTAQFALREAETVARNIWATLRGRRGEPFHFDSLGALCVVGHQTACAELTVPFARKRSVRFSGLLAWFMWRGIYLSKLPGLERKIRVLMAWTLELFFPRDIVQTIELG
jgi:NADH:ubiquinone reductase (H+-translocating)